MSSEYLKMVTIIVQFYIHVMQGSQTNIFTLKYQLTSAKLNFSKS